MTLKIENIRPDYMYEFDQYDSRNNWASGILRFTFNGDDRFEYLDEDMESALSDLDGRTRRAVKNRLYKWIVENSDGSFSQESDDPDVVAIWHGIDIADGVEIELTPEANERLNISDNAPGYAVNRRGVISWTDRDFGYQEIDNGAYGDQEFLTRSHNLANPESLIEVIEDRLEQLRAEAELDDDQDDEEAAA